MTCYPQITRITVIVTYYCLIKCNYCLINYYSCYLCKNLLQDKNFPYVLPHCSLTVTYYVGIISPYVLQVSKERQIGALTQVG